MFGLFKTAQWNNEPNQQQLAATILEGALYEITRSSQGKHLNIREMIAFTNACGWSDKEASNRFVHAVSMIKPLADAATYQAAKSIAQNLYNAYRA